MLNILLSALLLKLNLKYINPKALANIYANKGVDNSRTGY